eukprot:2486280-Pleurochrysis_carterae.AAC.3
MAAGDRCFADPSDRQSQAWYHLRAHKVAPSLSKADLEPQVVSQTLDVHRRVRQQVAVRGCPNVDVLQ